MLARVFESDGNRLITPIFAGTDADCDHSQDGTAASLFAMMVGLTDTRENIAIDEDSPMPNFEVTLRAGALAHGGMKMICIGGPELDKKIAETQTENR